MTVPCNKSRMKVSGWWFQPSERYESQLGWLFPICGKIKNVPNHQPGFASPLNSPMISERGHPWPENNHRSLPAVALFPATVDTALLHNAPDAGNEEFGVVSENSKLGQKWDGWKSEIPLQRNIYGYIYDIIRLYIYMYTQLCDYIIMIAYIEYALVQPFGCGTEKKTNIRIFMNIWGRNMWGKILECTNTAKANTIGITMFPYRKHVWNPADWHFFRNWFESQAAAAIHASVKNLGNGLFPGSKMDSLHILCTFFSISGRCFYSMYTCFLPIPENAFWGQNYRFYILCIPSWLYMFIHISSYHR